MKPSSLFATLFHSLVATLIVLGVAFGTISVGFAQSESDQTQTVSRDKLRTVIQTAFDATHEGWSSDEVILRDDLNRAFLKHCSKQLPEVSAQQFNWGLMNMRKAGKLKSKTTKRTRVDSSDVIHLAEIAARTLQDRHHVSSDRVMADPKLRAEFDRVAAALMVSKNDKDDGKEDDGKVTDKPAKSKPALPRDSKVDSSKSKSSKSAQDDTKSIDSKMAYRIRHAAMKLRKTRKLKPELITRIADWGREVTIHEANSIAAAPDQIPEHPGVYIFATSLVTCTLAKRKTYAKVW